MGDVARVLRHTRTRTAWRLLSSLVGLGVLVSGPIAVSAGDEREARFGFFMDRVMLSRNVVIFDPALNRRLGQIGLRLAQATGRTDMTYTFRIMNDPTIDACAAPGGFIYVNSGLLDVLDSEDEVAALLAHELAHTTEAHGLKSVEAARNAQIGGTIVAIGIGVGLSFAVGALVPTVTPFASPGPRVISPTVYLPNQVVNSAISRVVGDLAGGLGATTANAIVLPLLKGYGRSLEFEADRLAVAYLRRARYDGTALEQVFRKLLKIRNEVRAYRAAPPEAVLSLWHPAAGSDPSLEQRLEEIASLTGKRGQ